MNDDIIQDLKQFISVTVKQETSKLREEMNNGFVSVRSELKKLDVRLTGKIDDLSQYVAEALDRNNDFTDKILKNHEKRIKRLEHKVA